MPRFASMNQVLAEPIEDCLLRAPDGTPLRRGQVPGGPGERGGPARRPHLPPRPELAVRRSEGGWGVETEHERILLCGAGARRGGGVSGIPGHNAAMALLR